MVYQEFGKAGSAPKAYVDEQTDVEKDPIPQAQYLATSASASSAGSNAPVGLIIFGEPDGLQLLPLVYQWVIVGFTAVLSFAVLANPWLPDFNFSMYTALVIGCMSVATAISFAGSLPERKILILMAMNGSVLLLAWRLGYGRQFIIGTSTAAVYWFYMIVQAMGKASGQNEGDSYKAYTFLAPTAIGGWNALGLLLEQKLDLPEGSRWTLAVLIGSAVNVVAGKLSGTYNFTRVQYVRYIFGSMGLYIFVNVGMIQFIETVIFAEMLPECQSPARKPSWSFLGHSLHA